MSLQFVFLYFFYYSDVQLAQSSGPVEVARYIKGWFIWQKGKDISKFEEITILVTGETSSM